MLVVVKMPHIEIKGDLPKAFRNEILRRFGKDNVEIMDDDSADVRTWDWYQQKKTERTPGDTLRAYRKRDGLTQSQLAQNLNEYTQHISNMEKGIRSISVDMAKKLAEYFDTDYKMFL